MDSSIKYIVYRKAVVIKVINTVWKKRVLVTLYSWKKNGNLLNFTKNFLKNRTFNVKIYDKISPPHIIENGLPQGSVPSVTLFLVAINGICKNLPTLSNLYSSPMTAIFIVVDHK